MRPKPKPAPPQVDHVHDEDDQLHLDRQDVEDHVSWATKQWRTSWQYNVADPQPESVTTFAMIF